MSDEMLEWVRAYLERDEDIVVPIKKMWNEWHLSHPESLLDEFTAAILADEQVEHMASVDHNRGLEEATLEEKAEHEQRMEELGYFSGPRVKLKSREITREHIANMLKKHTDRMEKALRDARSVMPEDISEPDEGKLIDAIAMTRKLKKMLRKIGLGSDEE
jgi:hypothetical protein